MKIVAAVGFGALALLALLITLLTARFYTFDATQLDEFLRSNLLNHPIPFYIHVLLGPLVLILGIWQFLPVTRRGWYHRWAGRVYVAGVMASGIGALIVAPTTAAGPIVGTGFAIMAVLWLTTTAMAYLKVRAGRYAEHRRWMIRSYAVTCGAITLRIIVPVGLASGLDFPTAYLIAAWGCWSINLAIAELIIRRKKGPRDLPKDRVAPVADVAIA